MRLICMSLLLAAVITITACSKQTQTTTTAPESTAGANLAPEAATPASAGQGKGRIEMTGAIGLSRDFGVTPCSIAKPGKALLSGYGMSMARGDTIIESGGIHVPNYTKDGSYDIAFTQSIAEDPLQLNLLPSANLPHGSTLEQRSDSTIRIAINEGGMKGTATFKNFETLSPGGGRVSGIMTWACPKIIHFGM